MLPGGFGGQLYGVLSGIQISWRADPYGALPNDALDAEHAAEAHEPFAPLTGGRVD